MDSNKLTQLTPKTILKLMNIAQEKETPRKLPIENDTNVCTPDTLVGRSTHESSGILDLNVIKGLGESDFDLTALSKSTAFYPGEITGRSTGTTDITAEPEPLNRTRTFEPNRRHSLGLDSITNKLDQQTNEINDILRHSIASNYSFHSKRDLTADELSLIKCEAPLPVAQNGRMNIPDGASVNDTNLSMGTYFLKRCTDFGKILHNVESPNKSMTPSITEVSTYAASDKGCHKMDQSLDSIPVKQPRSPRLCKQTEIQTTQYNYAPQTNAKSKLNDVTLDKSKMPIPSQRNMQSKVSELENCSTPQTAKFKDRSAKKLLPFMQVGNDDTEYSMDSLSISKIADCIGKQSNVSITDILHLNNRNRNRTKSPLKELHMNEQWITEKVTPLKDTKNFDTASSAGTVNTVIAVNQKSRDKTPLAPSIRVSSVNGRQDLNARQSKVRSKSRSPSKSPSTLSTVHENSASFNSQCSPVSRTRATLDKDKMPSPNVYRELDKSVDWQEVMQQKLTLRQSLPREQWVDISATAVNGFVGVNNAFTVSMTTLVDSWLLTNLKCISELKNVNIQSPHFPVLLSPTKSETLTFYLTPHCEVKKKLTLTFLLKDVSIDSEKECTTELDVDIRMPSVQAVSHDGLNRLIYPPIQRKTSAKKCFMLISECAVDLHLELSIVEGEAYFVLNSVQEIDVADVNKVLADGWECGVQKTGKHRSKGTNKQLCKVRAGNALAATVTFNSPELVEESREIINTINGVINVNIFGVECVLKNMYLVGVVGLPKLLLPEASQKIIISDESTDIKVSNSGTVAGVWTANISCELGRNMFEVSPAKFQIEPGCSKMLKVMYKGPHNTITDGTLTFTNAQAGDAAHLQISGGHERIKSFPIKTNLKTMSWVRTCRKELSLKNSTDKTVSIKFHIVGDGFLANVYGCEPRRSLCLQFGPGETRPLGIEFTAPLNTPRSATLHLVHDRNSECSRKVNLFGYANYAGDCVRWAGGVVTCGETALVRAAARAPLALRLINRARAPAFVAATLQFNLHYAWMGGGARLDGARSVVRARCEHAVTLGLPWAAVRRRAEPRARPALATVTIIAGAEITRRRILRAIANEKGERDLTLLPDKLRVLSDSFDGEDPEADKVLADFTETTESLDDLIGGLQELTAQIDMPQDFFEDNTIVITDDESIVNHYTLCD